MLDDLLASFIAFFTAIDPIGTIPVFIAVTASSTTVDKKKMAGKAALVAAGVLIFFIIVGELLLDGIGIPLPTFQIAGGIVLFLFALTMIFGESKPESEVANIEQRDDKAIFPLAMPSLASPGAIMAAVLLTKNSENSVVEQFFVSLTMVVVILIAWIFMYYSTVLFKYIGNSGAAVISRIMGLILTALAVSHILEGISNYFNL